MSINAPARHDPIEISTRYPKNRIDVNPERIRTENPAITVKALIIMLLPIVPIADFVDSSYDSPFFSSELRHHIY
jgi:hypothetical protein